jgi:hypothetical protein
VPEFADYQSGAEITNIVRGLSINRIDVVDDRMDRILRIHLADGSVLEFTYEWIYEWRHYKNFTITG